MGWWGAKRRVSHYARVVRGHLLRRRVDEAGKNLTSGARIRIVRRARHTRVVLGDRVRLRNGVGFFLGEPGATIEIGSGTFISRRSEIFCRERVTIGDGCAIAWDVLIIDSDHHRIDGEKDTAPVSIGNHVWIGAAAKILKGVTIGEGAVVGAGSVVSGDVPPRTVVAGVPARVIRTDVQWS